MPLALFSFHHLLSQKKITSLRALSRKLSLSGVYRRGYPGVLFVSSSGGSSGVDEVHRFVREVKRMRWQTCLLAGFDAAKEVAFPHKGLEEVDKIRDVVRVAREHGTPAGGEDVEMWVKTKMGFVKDD